jgi:hypothetical protein
VVGLGCTVLHSRGQSVLIGMPVAAARRVSGAGERRQPVSMIGRRFG